MELSELFKQNESRNLSVKTLLIALTAFIFLPVSPLLAGTEDPKKILAIQHQTFAPYELSFQGFNRGLEESDYSGDLKVERFNANSDLEALKAKLLTIKERKGVDLIFAIGTRATQMAMEEIDEIPIVFTDLAAPEYSGIIKDWKSSGTNVTGVETPNFLSKGIYMLYQLTPFKKIGMIYLKGSPSHEGAVKQMKLVSKNLGTEVIYDSFSLTDEKGRNISRNEVRSLIEEKLENLLPRVDVFFVQTSKTFLDNFDLFLEKFEKYNSLSAGDPVYIKKGLVLGLDRNKFEFGKRCAEYAVQIFRGTPPAQLPMDVGQKFSISFNLKAAAVIGFTPPMYLLGAADAIYQDFQEDGLEKSVLSVAQ